MSKGRAAALSDAGKEGRRAGGCRRGGTALAP